ncbi:MAG: Fe-S cluster assembly protein SufD [Blastocatellia bacterium]
MHQAAKEKENYSSACRAFAKTREGGDPAWLRKVREDAYAAFQRLDFPTTQEEAWKSTNVAPLLRIPFRQLFDLAPDFLPAGLIEERTLPETRESRLVFINGIFAPGLSRLDGIPERVLVKNFSELDEEERSILQNHLGKQASWEEDAFLALNTALLGDGALVYLPRGRVVDVPIEILYLTTSEEPIVSYPRILVVAEEGSMATIIERYGSRSSNVYFTNAVTEVVLGQQASLVHYRLQLESNQAYHLGTTRVALDRQSRYESFAVSLGSGLGRHSLTVSLAGEEAEAKLDGLYVATGRQLLDHHTELDHRSPHCRSDQYYKGMLDDQARAIFNGKVLVREGAMLTDARQLNKNLLLSTTAKVDTRPQLEILADDVKCAHGATIGQLEEEELFYLASRGIPPGRAKALLTYGFAEDLIARLRIGSLREELDRIVLEKLHQSLEGESA